MSFLLGLFDIYAGKFLILSYHCILWIDLIQSTGALLSCHMVMFIGIFTFLFVKKISLLLH
jgi:hypothetical protein